jgi:hypothetical protein
MVESIGERGILHLLARCISERPAACGKNDTFDFVCPPALHRLKHSGVLRINGENLHPTTPRLGDQQRPGNDQRFLIRQRQRLPRPNCREHGRQPGSPHYRRQHDIHVRPRRQFHHPFASAIDLDSHPPNLANDPFGDILIRNRYRDRLMFAHLLKQFLRLRMRTEPRGPIRWPEPLNHLERIAPDRPRRTQNGDVSSQAVVRVKAQQRKAK